MMPNLCEPRIPISRGKIEDLVKIIEDSGHDNEEKKETKHGGEEEDRQDNEDNWDNYEEDDFELRTA